MGTREAYVWRTSPGEEPDVLRRRDLVSLLEGVTSVDGVLLAVVLDVNLCFLAPLDPVLDGSIWFGDVESARDWASDEVIARATSRPVSEVLPRLAQVDVVVDAVALERSRQIATDESDVFAPMEALFALLSDVSGLALPGDELRRLAVRHGFEQLYEQDDLPPGLSRRYVRATGRRAPDGTIERGTYVLDLQKGQVDGPFEWMEALRHAERLTWSTTEGRAVLRERVLAFFSDSAAVAEARERGQLREAFDDPVLTGALAPDELERLRQQHLP